MTEVKAFSSQELADLKLIHSEMRDPAALKAFRDLRTRLVGRSERENFVCLVVASESGGGSYVAANLAASIALDKTKSSVLVDCNLYAPSVEQYMPGGADVGLTDYLDDLTVTCEDIVYGTGVSRMRAVPVGNNRDGGTEKLTSERMKQVIFELKLRYGDRSIIVDAPSIANYEAEVLILADLCDFVVLVVPAGTVNEGLLLSQIARIGKERIAGVVFNEG
jgi:Mrp family chromosome partitioning ATPase